MNAALSRPALNATILVSVIFHLAVLYYIATAWQILPPLSQPTPPEHAFKVQRPEPPPPVVKDKPEPPRVQPHHVDRIEPTSTVPPLNLAPQPPTPVSPDAPIAVNAPVPEQPTSFVQPAYPAVALNGGREGHVRLSITILADGSVTDIEVISVSPAGYRFEQSAMDAVRKWHYPATGRVRTHVYVDVDYVLNG
ncbi:MAG: TonB family protein [Alphaproteobacteria bacterium]|nr:TonB family protein [Alphaproteobacteria bacterium]